jgi:hypothetical protein
MTHSVLTSDLPHCRACKAELLPLDTPLHRWWCTEPYCRLYHVQQALHMPQHVKMDEVRHLLAARIARATK